MLTGKRLFQGETISDTLAGILKSDPDWDALPEDTPDTVRLLLARCLERDRLQRLQDIGEARILLSGDGVSSLYSGFSRAPLPGEDSGGQQRGRRSVLAFAIPGPDSGRGPGWLVMQEHGPGSESLFPTGSWRSPCRRAPLPRPPNPRFPPMGPWPSTS